MRFTKLELVHGCDLLRTSDDSSKVAHGEEASEVHIKDVRHPGL